MKYYLKQLKDEWRWIIDGWRTTLKRQKCWLFHSWQWVEKVPLYSSYGRKAHYCERCHGWYGDIW